MAGVSKPGYRYEGGTMPIPPSRSDGGSRFCGDRDELSLLVCTREPGHEGRHKAGYASGDHQNVLASWDGGPETIKIRDLNKGDTFLWTEETKAKLGIGRNNPKICVDVMPKGKLILTYPTSMRPKAMVSKQVDLDWTVIRQPVKKTTDDFFAGLGL